MKPQTIGRVLGIGVRVAGRMAGQRLSGSGPSTPAAGPAVRQPVTIDAGAGSAASSGKFAGSGQAASRVSVRATGQATANVARGVGGFLRPFRRVGRMVLLEVVGVFFLLFVLVFGNWAWKLRDQAVHGPDHFKFLLYAGMMLVFFYLGASSFWRARRKIG